MRTVPPVSSTVTPLSASRPFTRSRSRKRMTWRACRPMSSEPFLNLSSSSMTRNGRTTSLSVKAVRAPGSCSRTFVSRTKYFLAMAAPFPFVPPSPLMGEGWGEGGEETTNNECRTRNRRTPKGTAKQPAVVGRSVVPSSFCGSAFLVHHSSFPSPSPYPLPRGERDNKSRASPYAIGDGKGVQGIANVP